MHIEELLLTNFRCFGVAGTRIQFASGLTAFVGTNGAGKTAVMHALQRLFGITGEQRRFRRQDFHIPNGEVDPVLSRTLSLEVILAFPELDAGGQQAGAIPEFFQQMAADANGHLKCRLRMEATWNDDGSLEGAVDQKYVAVRTFEAFQEADCTELKQIDRARIQMIYVPATRDGASQVAAFLRGRLWRAISWSPAVRQSFTEAGTALNGAFTAEPAVGVVAEAVAKRWQQVHSAGTDTVPVFRPIDLRFDAAIRKVEVLFSADEGGRERSLAELSDGQRSLFHLAMTAASLDIESSIANNAAGFQVDNMPLPALTLIAVEEPENNLAPLYLSRIVRQIEELTSGSRAQAVISSHSASILARVDPTQIRHFRLNPESRIAQVSQIRLPPEADEASKYVREAVRTYPELYFARYVILGEGASEEVVLPRLAEAMGLEIDRSFVAVVPLGGRHVNHLWRLLSDLSIPHSTLLDLDWGRSVGGWARIKTACEQLLAIGVPAIELFNRPELGDAVNLEAFNNNDPADFALLTDWMAFLRRFNVFLCSPLDLDYSMLVAFSAAYQQVEPGRQGPAERGDPRDAVLGVGGLPQLYRPDKDILLRWYRYLFLGRGKPGTHVRVLSSLSSAELQANIPEELRELLSSVAARLAPVQPVPAPPQNHNQPVA